METPDVNAFIKKLSQLERSKSTPEKFSDFCELAYCAYAKCTAPTPERAEALEARYMAVVERYADKDAIRAYPELLAMVCLAVQAGEDFLGTVAAKLAVLDLRGGQFFTPRPVSELMAGILLQDADALIEKQGFITVQEPAAGAGGMVLAAAEVLLQRGHDLHTTLLVEATELQRLSYQMCFIQLAAKGIAAQVIHGNSLSREVFESAWTPAALLFKAHHGHLFPPADRLESVEATPPEKERPPARPDDPPALFSATEVETRSQTQAGNRPQQLMMFSEDTLMHPAVGAPPADPEASDKPASHPDESTAIEAEPHTTTAITEMQDFERLAHAAYSEEATVFALAERAGIETAAPPGASHQSIPLASATSTQVQGLRQRLRQEMALCRSR